MGGIKLHVSYGELRPAEYLVECISMTASGDLSVANSVWVGKSVHYQRKTLICSPLSPHESKDNPPAISEPA